LGTDRKPILFPLKTYLYISAFIVHTYSEQYNTSEYLVSYTTSFLQNVVHL